jgi:hypothetical protein
MVVWALPRSIQAISAYNDNPLVRVQDCMVSLSLVGGAKAGNWARIANALELVWKQARVVDAIKMVRVLARP